MRNSVESLLTTPVVSVKREKGREWIKRQWKWNMIHRFRNEKVIISWNGKSLRRSGIRKSLWILGKHCFQQRTPTFSFMEVRGVKIVFPHYLQNPRIALQPSSSPSPLTNLKVTCNTLVIVIIVRSKWAFMPNFQRNSNLLRNSDKGSEICLWRHTTKGDETI